MSLGREGSGGDQAQARHAVPRRAAAVEQAARLLQKVAASLTRTASVYYVRTMSMCVLCTM